MKYLFLLCYILLASTNSNAQRKYAVTNIKLPPALSYYDNQFSGLYIHDSALYLMSESRLQDKKEALLYSIQLKDLDHYKTDSNYILPYKKHPILGLDVLRTQMKKQQQEYEGLEAIVIDGNNIYLSVETNTPSDYCYLLKGSFADSTVVMDTTILQQMRKPTKPNGDHIYNAGFEAVTMIDNKLHTFFEYNYFDDNNYIYRYDASLNNRIDSIKISPKLPFRITDITQTSETHFIGINFFYKGEGDDEVYRLPNEDKNNRYIKDGDVYKNYIRLIDIHISNKKATWKILLELPVSLMGYNWEGIAAYKNGYFIINDKYTPAKPYSTVLLYLERWK